MDLKQHIRSVPDFPKPGVLFYDISTLLAHAEAWHETVSRLAATLAPRRPDVLVGIELRGFLVAAPLAFSLNCGFVMVRKKGKLPGPTVPLTYALEYGTDTIEIQADGIVPGQRVAVLDDLLATGGTIRSGDRALPQGRRQCRRGGVHHRAEFLGGRKRIDVPLTTVLSLRVPDAAAPSGARRW